MSPLLASAPAFLACAAPERSSSLISVHGNVLMISTELSSEQSSTTVTSKSSQPLEKTDSRHLPMVAPPFRFGMITEICLPTGTESPSFRNQQKRPNTGPSPVVDHDCSFQDTAGPAVGPFRTWTHPKHAEKQDVRHGIPFAFLLLHITSHFTMSCGKDISRAQ